MAAADFTFSMSDVQNMFSVVSACLLLSFSNALFALFKICGSSTLLNLGVGKNMVAADFTSSMSDVPNMFSVCQHVSCHFFPMPFSLYSGFV